MLVKLNSSTSGEMIMLAVHLRPLFEIIGKACSARGVFTVDQLPEAIGTLQRAVHEAELKAREEAGRQKAQDRAEPTKDEDDGEEDEDEVQETVTLSQRAQPLIRLMTLTLQEGGFILWEAEGDF